MNAQVFNFELTDEDIAHLDTLDEGVRSHDLLIAFILVPERCPSPDNRLGSYQLRLIRYALYVGRHGSFQAITL